LDSYNFLSASTNLCEMEAHRADVKFKEGCPSITCIDNPTILPKKNKKGGPVWGLGGVIDKDDAFIEESAHLNGWSQFGGAYEYDKTSTVFINEDVIWGGVFIKHWGHFFVDFMTRVWLPALYQTDKKLVYVANEKDFIDGNFSELLLLMGINTEQLIKVTVPTSFKSVTIPALSFKKSDYYFQEFSLTFKKAVNSIDASFFQKYKYRKVYFSRTNLKDAKRKEVGEKLIEKSFQKAGFDIVQPEKLNVIEQICLWNTATEIACLNGTIPLNIPISNRKELKVLVLNKSSRLHENLIWLETVFDRRITYIDVYDPLLTNKKRSLGKGPFIMFVTRNLSNYFAQQKVDIEPTNTTKIILLRISFLWLYSINTFNPIAKKLKRALNKFFGSTF